MGIFQPNSWDFKRNQSTGAHGSDTTCQDRPDEESTATGWEKPPQSINGGNKDWLDQDMSSKTTNNDGEWLLTVLVYCKENVTDYKMKSAIWFSNSLVFSTNQHTSKTLTYSIYRQSLIIESQTGPIYKTK